MDTPGSEGKIPTWQRVVCALFALGGLVVFGLMVAQGFSVSETGFLKWYRYFTVVAALIGVYLFAFAGLKGRLPDQLRRSKNDT